MTAQQLKNSILQMAVQGKLVPQDPNDEPASVLLERIRAEKEKLIKEGKIKKEKNPSVIFRGEDNLPYEKVGNNEPVCIADEVPFEIPESWEWARCSSIGSMVRGKGIKRIETSKTGLPCIRYGEIYTSYNTSFSEAISFIPDEIDKSCNHFSYGDIVFTLTGENKPDIAKAVAYLGSMPVAAGGDLAFWTAHGMNPLFLTYFFNSPYCIELKKRLATGDIIVHISTDKIGSFLIPVPPIEEQKRIINKISKVVPLLEEYNSKQIKTEELSVRFPELLKKSILQQAVMGKLVPQDSTDEPAYILLDKIRAEKAALIKAGKLKKDKHESIIYRRDNSHYQYYGLWNKATLQENVRREEAGLNSFLCRIYNMLYNLILLGLGRCFRDGSGTKKDMLAAEHFFAETHYYFKVREARGDYFVEEGLKESKKALEAILKKS